jgi:hypothetical protein
MERFFVFLIEVNGLMLIEHLVYKCSHLSNSLLVKLNQL